MVKWVQIILRLELGLRLEWESDFWNVLKWIEIIFQIGIVIEIEIGVEIEIRIEVGFEIRIGIRIEIRIGVEIENE